MSITTSTDRKPAEPAWDVARLFPNQGTWSVADYFELTQSTNNLVEFDNGHIEVLQMPTEAHQFITRYLFLALYQFTSSSSLGEAVFAPIRVQTVAEKYREPDIAFMLTDNRDRRSNKYWTGADLVMEVVSPDSESRERDLEKKREEYAAAGIPEYWIVDPQDNMIIVLTLEDGKYNEHGRFMDGDQATSVLLSKFSVAVTEVFAATEDE